MPDKMRWPAWVWHEDDAAQYEDIDIGLGGMFDYPAWAIARYVLLSACMFVQGRTTAPNAMINPVWYNLPPTRRRLAWRLAMGMLGYTEVCDA